MDRVAGIQTGGSERAFDLYMKARYLDEQHPGHGVTFATGTPISQHDGRDVHDAALPRPRGAAEPRHRAFRRLGRHLRRGGRHDGNLPGRGDACGPAAASPGSSNLPELQQMFRAFADVQTAEMLDLPRPAPRRRQADRRRLPDVRRASTRSRRSWSPATSGCGRRRSTRGRTTPWPSPPTAASSPSTPGCSRARRPDFPGSKINALVEQRRRHLATHGSDPRHADDLLRHGREPDALGLLGLRRDHRRSSSPAASPASRSPPSATPTPTPRSRPSSRGSGNGSVRVLIGSTQKMGTGTNVQKRLVALHHLDAPWKPAEVEQREGRILRQGNENEEVAIYRYVTEGSFDAYMWQALETKARFIAPGHDRRERPSGGPRTSAARSSPTPRSRPSPRATRPC